MADTDYLAASDGTGDAALMHVTSPRVALATIIQVDTVVGVPAFFIGTWGTLLASGFIDPTTKRDFFGHVNAGTLVIDKMAPGNTDGGNTTGQVVVIKPSTPAQNTVSAAIKAGTTFPGQFANFVEPGGAVWTLTSGLVGAMSAGFVWLNGVRTAVSAIASHTFVLNQDTYVDINPSTGVATYVAVANGVSEPAVTASSVRIAKVVTGASAITLIVSSNYSQPVRGNETQFNFIAYGCTWTGDSLGSTLNATMTAGVVYIAGKRLTVAPVTSRLFSASVDTYVDFQDNGDGTAKIIYTTATNNTVSPAIPNSLTEPYNIRNAIIVTGAGSIAAAGSINQGQETSILPIVSSVPYCVVDGIGNLICPRDPKRDIIGYRQISTGDFSTSSTSAAQITGLSASIIIPTGRKISMEIIGSALYSSNASVQPRLGLWDGTVGSGAYIGAGIHGGTGSPTQVGGGVLAKSITTLSGGLHTINASLKVSAAGTATLENGAYSDTTTKEPSILVIRLV